MAVGLAAELKESLKVDVELIRGERGIFDIQCNEELIFSKAILNRFPYFGEISKILSAEPYASTHE
jgi:hypothetical protein